MYKRATWQKLFLLGLLLLLGACASSYQLNRETQSLLAQLDATQARNLLHGYMMKDERGGGFCVGGMTQRSGYQTHDQLMLTTRGELNFLGHWQASPGLKGFTLIEEVENYPLELPQGWQAGRLQVDLTEIETIRIKDTKGIEGESFCEGLLPGKLILASAEAGQTSMYINVVPEHLNRALAGLRYFARDAEMLEGTGF
ncbi:hypothetical protein [Marinospirillum perlucidum]|uniref:hypothetical protein n=1 Tax=Marinospirillum perlucidum TaxID=1982602 RepID=UPI000DF3F67B|nr:hypothetical protein [Marinospirillum perlucidum]